MERTKGGVLSQIEDKLGLPRLSKIAESFERFPDGKQLKTIKDVMTVAERVSQSAPDLDKVVMLLREINSLPMEKLEKLEKILKRIESIMKQAPEDLLSFLGSLKEE